MNSFDIKYKEIHDFLINARKYLEEEYPYKNKDAYLQALDKCQVPDFICLDIEKREISYKIFDKIKYSWNLKNGIFTYTYDLSVKGIITNVAALMSGKKQEAVLKVAKNRRMPDGSYVGIDKMHVSKLKNNTYQKASEKTAKVRRMPDGSYKGHDKAIKTKIEKGIHLIAAAKIAKNRRMPDGSYKGVTIPYSPQQINEILKEKWPGYEYLEEGIRGTSQKSKYKCDKGHIFYSDIGTIREGCGGCQICVRFIMEQNCRGHFEFIFQKPFPKIRPEWLRNPFTKGRLELDGYNDELRLAFEFDGPTHYKPVYGQETLQKQQERDIIKNELCAQNGVYLIRIPYSEYKRCKEFIEEELSKFYGKNNK